VELMAQVNLLCRLGRTHRRLIMQNRQLEHSFRELDQFARVVSHDLKEPLRTLANHCRLLKERAGSQLDAESTQLVDQALRGSRRMQQLIDDLLLYCRAGQEEPPAESVDLNGVLGQVIEHLDAAIRQHEATVTVDALPRVRGSHRMMVQLFQNLVGNAVKFHGPVAPEVRVAARQGNKHCRVTVRDNGIGILPRDHDRIFRVFERLHADGDRPGTGIGLAICKKIVDRHGGRIWVESEPGRGAAFHVELSAAVALQPAVHV
jgi:light-regulated signal transduction histidine kinase (bacteriophytochrome)